MGVSQEQRLSIVELLKKTTGSVSIVELSLHTGIPSGELARMLYGMKRANKWPVGSEGKNLYRYTGVRSDLPTPDLGVEPRMAIEDQRSRIDAMAIAAHVVASNLPTRTKEEQDLDNRSKKDSYNIRSQTAFESLNLLATSIIQTVGRRKLDLRDLIRQLERGM